MKSKLLEWYRIVNPNPDDTTIEKRTNTIDELISHINRDEDYNPLINCIAVVSSGFENGFNNESEFVKSVLTYFRNHQPTFQGDLTKNALEMRVCCAIALGEILSNSSGKYEVSEGIIELAAGLLISGVGLLTEANERHLVNLHGELLGMSLDALNGIAIKKRKRNTLNLDVMEKITVPADLPTYHTTFWGAIKPILENIEKQMLADREELEVLWWLYNGLSENNDKPLRGLTPGEAAIACGAEIAQKIIMPPLRNIRQIVLKAIDNGLNKNKNQEKPLKAFVKQWGESSWNLLLPKNTDIRELIEEFPMLFPFSWLCFMLSKSKGTSGWNSEFELKTGINTESPYTPKQIAIQAFNEGIAQQIYNQYLYSE